MNKTIGKLGRRLRLGVIGGGPGSFIGTVHRTAARMDDNFEVVASVLSSDAERSRREGRAIGVAADRAYATADEMFAKEKARGDGIDAVAIMTPNDSHYPLAVKAIDAGLDIIADKPLTTRLEDALDLVKRVRASGIVFCQTFNYTGFPLVRQARAMVRDGDLGDIRMVHVEYVQGHNATLTRGEQGDPPNNWHFRPERVGPSLILGDIGSHAHHMASFVTGQNFAKVMADIATVVPGRNADDHAGILFRLDNGAPGVMWVTQAGAGAVHGLYFRVFGAKGGLEWRQETPNQLFHSRLAAPAQIFERGGSGLKPEALRTQRIGIGHPEAYQEAFAVLYADAAEAIVARRLGEKPNRLAMDFPTVEDGARTMKFITAAVESSRTGKWVDTRLDL
ncbi:MAG TPA: Gfo/Idh/MocA family oxidoreductase [Bauldia sp.]|nr:Gfo/Idh/MocA family oxidoreductase [Bauldia sp.]